MILIKPFLRGNTLLLAVISLVTFVKGQVVEPRIVYGNAASEGEYPFFVRGVGCGGTLIHPQVVLSAAHCQFNATYGAWTRGNSVFIGSVDKEYGTEFIVDTWLWHPAWSPNAAENDIMLVKLTTPSSAPLVRLNTKSSTPSVGLTTTVIGFGLTDGLDKNSSSEVLREVDIPVLPADVCSKTLYPIDPETELCAGARPRSFCRGDSGGPMLDTKTGVQYGIVSRLLNGPGAERCVVPGIFTRVSAHMDWIQKGVSYLTDDFRCIGDSPSPGTSKSGSKSSRSKQRSSSKGSSKSSSKSGKGCKSKS